MNLTKSPLKSCKPGMQTVRFNPLSGLIRQVLVPFGLLAVPSVVVASPQGGVVTDGQGAISSQGAVTTVQQHSQRLVTQWNSFNIDINEAVNFLQPSSSAIALARILDQSPSQILGGISANGRLVLSNPNGLIFAPSATVNVGSLIASGLDITAGDFMAGNLRFDASGTGGTVINHGLLQAATGGSINLLGGAVVNTGTIVADYGEVNLGAGRTATLDFDGDGLIQFAVEGDLTSDGNGSGIAISNSGVIQANGGQVLLLAQAAKDVFSQVINNSGVIRAQGIDTSGGTVRLVGNGNIDNSGEIDVTTTADGETGGSISLIGEDIASTGKLVADTASSNGNVLIQSGVSGEGSETHVSGEVAAENIVIEGGDGDDEFDIAIGNSYSVDGGEGSDTYSVALGEAAKTVTVADSGIEGGNDLANFYLSEQATGNSVGTSYTVKAPDETGKAGELVYDYGQFSNKVDFSGIEPINDWQGTGTLTVNLDAAGETASLDIGTLFTAGTTGAVDGNASGAEDAYVLTLSVGEDLRLPAIRSWI